MPGPYELYLIRHGVAEERVAADGRADRQRGDYGLVELVRSDVIRMITARSRVRHTSARRDRCLTR